MLVVSGDDDDDGQSVRGQTLDHVEAAGCGHLQIEQHEVGLQAGDAIERLDAIFRLTDDLNILNGGQFVPQNLAGYRFVIDDEGTECLATAVLPHVCVQ